MKDQKSCRNSRQKKHAARREKAYPKEFIEKREPVERTRALQLNEIPGGYGSIQHSLCTVYVYASVWIPGQSGHEGKEKSCRTCGQQQIREDFADDQQMRRRFFGFDPVRLYG